ncbi:MAG TPA: cyclase, partial [Mycobacterium sp.]|nr:cyclase [Mycobacterium sp.]
IESLGDPTLIVGLSLTAIRAKAVGAEFNEVLRWSQRVIDLADGDPSKGNFLIGSPLAVALTSRAIARWCLGRLGWCDDLRRGLAMARSTDPLSYARVVTYVYYPGLSNGILRSDASAVREIEDALRIAERSGDDFAFALARLTLGVALVHRRTAAERNRGQQLLDEVSEVLLRPGYNLAELPIVNVYLARERARCGECDEAMPFMRAAADHLCCGGRLLAWGVPATGVLMKTLLDRSTDGDVADAKGAIDRLATAPADDGLVGRDIWPLHLRASLARVHGDDFAYRDYRDRYRDMARTLGFEGHIAWAEAMP